MRAAAAVVVLSLVGLLGFGVSAASAAPKGVAAFFGNPPGVNSSPLAGEFGAGAPRGVAVNTTGAGPADPGDIYVADESNRRIQRFSVLGKFERMWGRDVIAAGAAADLGDVAEVCVDAADCKAGARGSLGGEFGDPRGIAVDQETGVVYVVEPSFGASATRVQAFDGDGNFLWAAGKNVVQRGGSGDVDAGSVVVNERQSVTIQGPFDFGNPCFCAFLPVTGGTFTLTFDADGAGPQPGQATGGIPYNAPATGDTTAGIDSVQEALEGLASIDPGEVAVTGPAGGGWTVEFTGDLGGINHAQMTADGSGLTPAGSSAFVGTSQNGSTTFPGPAEVCVVAAQCQASEIGARGGEFGNDGGLSGITGGGSGIAVVPTDTGGPLPNAGNVVVTDRGNRRVQELTASGGFVRAFGWDVVDGVANPGAPGDDSVAPANQLEICTSAATCKIGVAGSGLGQFANSGPNRVAVDSTGRVYTVENGANFRLQRFTPAGSDLVAAVVNPNVGGSGPALNLTGTNTQSSPIDVAVGPGDRVFVLKAYPAGSGTPTATVAERRVVELDATGGYVETHASRGGIASVLYLAINTDSEEIYLPTGSPVDGNGNGVYIVGESAPPTVSMGVGGVSTHTAQLNGLVNPGGPDTAIGIVTTYRFEYRKVGAPTWTPLGADRSVGNGFATVPVTAELTDLEADTAYEARLIASKRFSGVASIETAPEAFSTPASRPDIDAVYATDRDATSATLNARINPNGETTTYRFEYGPTAAYGTTIPIPDANAGDGTGPQIFSQAISGLAPQTTYHYRVVATSANGTNTTADHTLTTRPATQAPDGRGYELVSPADKIGGSGVGVWYAGVGSHGNAGIAAYDGERFASLSYYGASLIDGAFSYGSDWTLGQRTPAGWVNPPAFTRPGGQGSSEFAKIPLVGAASDDLSLTAWNANSQLAIFAEQPEVFGDSLGTTGGAALRDWDSGRWEILAPWAPGQQVGGTSSHGFQVAAGGGYALAFGGLRGVGGPGDPTADPCSMSCDSNVYIDDVTAGLSNSFPGEGVRSLVNVCTGAGSSRTAIPSVDGAGRLAAAPCPGPDNRPVSARGASVPAQGSLRGQMSDDGTRVFFMSPDHFVGPNNASCAGVGAEGTACPPQLYVRQRNGDDTIVTRWISKSAIGGQDASLLATAVFEGATPDGDKVFFRTASPLTADDPNGGVQVPGGVRSGTPSPVSVDLYMYDFPNAPGADPGDGTLTRISAGPTGDGDPNVSTHPVASNTTALRTFADDGSRAYFVTASRLPGVAAASGTITTPGGTPTQASVRNLYLYDTAAPADRRWRFVAQLPADTALGSCATTGSFPGKDLLLAGFNGTGLNGLVQLDDGANCVRGTADGSLVTFFTDGRLTSDDPDGDSGDMYAYDAGAGALMRISAPEGGAAGGSYVCVTDGIAGAGGARCHGDPRVSGLGTMSRRPLSVVGNEGNPADRSAFFESASRLVAEDRNDVYDVYRWRNGDLSLVSTGNPGAEPALYQGTDWTGKNVFFSTRDRLSWQDHDAVLDVYTARVGGGIPEPVEPPMCELLADRCQGGGAAPVVVPTSQTRSPSPGAGETVGEARRTLAVGRLSRRARRAAARSGVLRIVVRTNRAGRVTAVAKARLGKRTRRIARSTVRLRRAGRATLRLRLSRPTRERLRGGRALGVRVRVTSPGAKARAMTVRLPGAGS